jgi:hypothetical protein
MGNLPGGFPEGLRPNPTPFFKDTITGGRADRIPFLSQNPTDPAMA